MNNLLRFSTFHLHSISWSWCFYYTVLIIIFSFCITNFTLRELFMVIFFYQLREFHYYRTGKRQSRKWRKVLKITIKERRRYAHLFRIKYVISCFLHTHSTTYTHTLLCTQSDVLQLISDRLQCNKGSERSLYLCPCPLAETAHCADWDCQHSVLAAAERQQQWLKELPLVHRRSTDWIILYLNEQTRLRLLGIPSIKYLSWLYLLTFELTFKET